MFVKGGGYDSESTKRNAPLKLPPLYFYSVALERVLEICQDRPVYCFVFTDAEDPQRVIESIAQNISLNQSIVFDYRTENHRDKNVLEDFFSLFNFDILIRPESNFSIVPSLLHEYAIVCTPFLFRFEEGSVFTEGADLQIRDDLLQSLFMKVEKIPS